MKKVIYLGLFVGVTLLCFAFSVLNKNEGVTSAYLSLHYPNGVGIAGYTGAPGEFNCGDCHNCDAVKAGLESRFQLLDSLKNPVTAYELNHTYTIVFKDTIAGNKGFQCTVLSDSNLRVGNLIAGQNTLISTLLNSKTAAVRQYINHSNPFTTTWTFQWKAPATNIGKATFYFSTGNYQTIYLSNYSILPKETKVGPTTGIVENANAFAFTAFYSGLHKQLFLRYNAPEDGKGYLNILDETGKFLYRTKIGVFEQGLNTNEVSVPVDLQSGFYIVQLFVNNYFSTQKIYVQ